VSEWLLFNANSAIFQLQVYRGENKLNQWDDDEVRFVLDQHAELDFYSASSLKQQSTGRHVAPLGHIILTNLLTYGDFPAQDLQVLFARLFTFYFQIFVGHVTVPLNVWFVIVEK
jgi:hypothetical protein